MDASGMIRRFVCAAAVCAAVLLPAHRAICQREREVILPKGAYKEKLKEAKRGSREQKTIRGRVVSRKPEPLSHDREMDIDKKYLAITVSLCDKSGTMRCYYSRYSRSIPDALESLYPGDKITVHGRNQPIETKKTLGGPILELRQYQLSEIFVIDEVEEGW